MIPSLGGLQTKAKEALFPNEVRLTTLDTIYVFQVFQCLGKVLMSIGKLLDLFKQSNFFSIV